MTRWRVAAALIWLPAACAQSDALKIEIYSLAPSVIQPRLELVTPNMNERRARLESLFREVGCDGEYLTEKPILHLKDPNLVCVLPGTTSTKIVVGGHHDLVNQGIGAVDGWSGAVMLPSPYQDLKSKEGGLLGSRAYVKQLSAEERKLIHAMINLECLGTSPPKVWASRADKRLLAFYAHLAPGIRIKAGLRMWNGSAMTIRTPS
jgi:Peptidase family M28